MKPLLILLAATALAYPFLVRARFHEVLISLGGHGAEAVFAAIFFWRAIERGIYQEFERPLYAMLAWYLWGRNLVFCFRLMTDDWFRGFYTVAVRGTPNDYVKVAASLGWRLESVAALMLAFTIIVPLVALSAWWILVRSRERSAQSLGAQRP